MNDFALLRQYEPVIHFTQGELFYPWEIGAYLAQCALWERDRRGQLTLLCDVGQLTPDKLGAYSHTAPGHTLYLRFVQEPLDRWEYQRWRMRKDRPAFYAPGRLARVGLASRFLGALTDLSLLARGGVPGGTTAAAEQQYRRIQQANPQYVYYGRALREGGYLILHYLYFYPMNNWRSTFYGVNDHEADWEQVFVYLSDEDTPEPLWVAYAAHDYSGDDLRRRWDDPCLDKYDGTHPVVYAGAGSHASYFERGEYLMNVQPAFLLPLKRLLHAARIFWAERLRQGDAEKLAQQLELALGVPFVDYARGDGLRVGPGQPAAWTPVVLEPGLPWVEDFRGLWGLDTRDPVGGERAPAGPKYNRDSTVRQAWHDPLGWAGLNKVLPPDAAAQGLRAHIGGLGNQIAALEEEIARQRDALRLRELEVRALQQSGHADKLYKVYHKDVAAQEQALDALHTRRAELQETLAACQGYLDRVQQHQWGDPQAHLQHQHRPETTPASQRRIVELWAALSAGLLLLVFALSVVFYPDNWLGRIILTVSLFIVIESILRRRVVNLLLTVTVTLGVVTAAILAVEFLNWLLLAAFVGLGGLLIMDNLRELRMK